MHVGIHAGGYGYVYDALGIYGEDKLAYGRLNDSAVEPVEKGLFAHWDPELG